MATTFLNAWVRRQSRKLRARKLGWLAEALREGATVLDVGVWCRFPEPHPGENWLEKQPMGRGRLIAAGLEDMRAFKAAYPHILCVQADGAALPFCDDAVDIAAANAVLEHVHPDKREGFIVSMTRVARKHAWLAIPDRYCPLEVHTRIPFVHWLPNWRALLRRFGHKYWSEPEHLNVLSKRVLLRALVGAGTRAGSWRVVRQTALGVPVSLLAEFRPTSGDEPT